MYEALATICDLDNLMDSRHHPVEMQRGCEAFMEGWEQSFEEFLMTRQTNEFEANKEIFCDEITRACYNVQPTEFPSEESISNSQDMRIDLTGIGGDVGDTLDI